MRHNESGNNEGKQNKAIKGVGRRWCGGWERSEGVKISPTRAVFAREDM